MAKPKPLHYEKHGELCILSVDDDAVNLMVIEQLLAPQGWKVISAQDGIDAMAVLQQEETWPDFIFLDYQMNVGDSGDEICRKMREVFGAVPIPIVMCTAMTGGSQALADCKAAGATDFLLKPYERTKMMEKVALYCGDKVKEKSKPAATSPAPAPAAAAPAPPPPSKSPAEEVLDFFQKLDLEYCGQRLAEGGYTMPQIRAMDDAALRKAGIVVKMQRDKIVAACNS
mmetsp:Transcript_25580/g.64897  ORF Transcript_25580/g.64897 Transcript_25580/m.64897 type:complete len:228 (+) Transcript_25580:74-757(+)